MKRQFPLVRLSELTKPILTWSPERGDRQHIKYIDVSAVSREKLSIISVAEHTPSSAPSRARKIVCSQDTIFATIRPGLKRIAKVPEGLDDSIASTAFCILRPNLDHIDPDFLFFAVSSHSFVRAVEELQTGASYPAVRDRDVYAQEIPLPPLLEQVQIATILRTIRRSLSLESRCLAEAAHLKQSAMRELFTRGLRSEPSKETEIGPIPASWKIVPLSEVATIERGCFRHRPRNEPRFYGGSMPFVQTGDVVRSAGHIRDFTQTLNDDGVAISKVFPVGTILITIAANIGYTGILMFTSACPDSLVGITPKDVIDNYFLEYYLQTQQSEMDRQAPKGTQKNINIQFLSPWPVPLPTIEEQRQIADVLGSIDRKLDLHKQRQSVLEQLFAALSHKLMTGEIGVSEFDFSALPPTQDVEEDLS